MNQTSKVPLSVINDCLDISAIAPKESIFCFIGSQGLGKTACVKQWCEKNGRRLVPFSLVQRGPIELSGMFMPDDEARKMKIYDCETLSSLTDNDVLFFDELFESSPEVQAACLTILQERELLSGKKLPDNLIICAATNRSSSPECIKDNFKDRFEFVEISFNFHQWKAWVEKNLNIMLPNDIKDVICLDDKTDVWNVFTPRTVYKWIVRWIKATDKQKEKIKYLLSYSPELRDCLRYIVDRDKQFETIKAMTASIIRSETKLCTEREEICNKIFKADSFQQVWNALQSLPSKERTKIKQTLMETSLD